MIAYIGIVAPLIHANNEQASQCYDVTKSTCLPFECQVMSLEWGIEVFCSTSPLTVTGKRNILSRSKHAYFWVSCTSVSKQQFSLFIH